MPLIPVDKAPESRRERLAINLHDLDRMDPMLRQQMTRDRLDLKAIISMDKNREDETALAFSCSFLEAALVCDLIRSEDRVLKQSPTRIYLYRLRKWTRLSRNAVLTSLDERMKTRLNPEAFRDEDEIETPKPPKRERLEL